jgi:hypothetical protein
MYELTDPTTSAPEAVAAIESDFPAAALAWLTFDGAWSRWTQPSLWLSACQVDRAVGTLFLGDRVSSHAVRHGGWKVAEGNKLITSVYDFANET